MISFTAMRLVQTLSITLMLLSVTCIQAESPAASHLKAVASTTPATSDNAGANNDSKASTASSPAQPEMDLADLEDRLVDTDAIGFFTKLELKSQIDELTEKFREFHAVEAASDNAVLDRLREKFDLLLLKLLTLLQDDDPTLHRDVAMARPQIWETFSDPELFAKL